MCKTAAAAIAKTDVCLIVSDNSYSRNFRNEKSSRFFKFGHIFPKLSNSRGLFEDNNTRSSKAAMTLPSGLRKALSIGRLLHFISW